MRGAADARIESPMSRIRSPSTRSPMGASIGSVNVSGSVDVVLTVGCVVGGGGGAGSVGASESCCGKTPIATVSGTSTSDGRLVTSSSPHAASIATPTPMTATQATRRRSMPGHSS